MKKVLIIGRGTLGSSFRDAPWLGSCAVEWASRRKAPGQHVLDISRADEVSRFFSTHSDYALIINCAAMSQVDQCEKEPELARSANALAVRSLARASREHGIPLAHISTDYVFSGEKNAPYGEDDPTGPCSIYGLTKLEGEYYALHESPCAVVIRPSWIFGGEGNNFVGLFTERLEGGEPIQVIGDQTSCLTYAADLVRALGTIVTERLWPAWERRQNWHEIFHVTNEGASTRYDVVIEMRRILSKDNRVSPIAGHDLPGWIALRPRCSELSKDKYFHIFGARLRPWQKALEDYLLRDRVASLLPP